MKPFRVFQPLGEMQAAGAAAGINPLLRNGRYGMEGAEGR